MKHKKTVSKTRGRRAQKALAKSTVRKSLQRNPKKALVKQRIRRARPIHKRVLLHPVSILIILCAGVFIIGWTYRAIADSFNVTAEVLAAPLGSGAFITSPTDNSVSSSSPITASGLCPIGSYVKLYRNSIFSGVAVCSNTGTFQIETDLFVGENTLVAQDYNVTDQPGPVTPGISVKYIPPASVPETGSNTSSTGSHSSSTSATSSCSSVPPLLITSDFSYHTFLVGGNFSWVMQLQGGEAPYTIHIYWGDGQTSTQGLKTASVLHITHKYKGQGYYSIKVQAKDACGAVRVIQLAALIKTPGSAGIITTNTSGSTTPPTQRNSFWTFFGNSQNWIWLAWLPFIVVLLMVLSFWLGERREYQEIYYGKRQARRSVRVH
jgi:hypothetical protein